MFLQQASNASGVVVAGPFSILSPAQNNYVDVSNLTCAPLTPREQAQLYGPEIMLWDDAQDTSGSDLLVSAMQTLFSEAEIAWSPRAFIATNTTPTPIDAGRWTDHRCRLARRFVTSHPAPFMDVGAACTNEYEGTLAPWSN